MVEQAITGSSLNRRIRKWESIYGAIERYLPNSYTQVPMGDPRYGKINATGNTSREKHADGLASAAWTPVGGTGLTDLDGTIEYVGPGEIPVIPFNGSDEYLSTPDNAYWTQDDAGGANGFSVGGWANMPNLTGSDTLMGKYSNGNGREWLLYFPTGKVSLIVRDESASAGPDVTTSAQIPGADQWVHVMATYDGTGGDTALSDPNALIYVNGVLSTVAVTNDEAYEGMEDGTGLVTVGASLGGGSNSPANHFGGKMAGGPCGPIFTQTELTAAEIAAIYRTQAAALGVL